MIILNKTPLKAVKVQGFAATPLQKHAVLPRDFVDVHGKGWQSGSAFRGIVPVWRPIGGRQPLAEDRGPDSLEGVGSGVQRAFFPFGSAGDGRSAVPWFDSAEAPDGSERSGGGAVDSGERASTSLLRLRGVRDGFGAGAEHTDEAAQATGRRVLQEDGGGDASGSD